MRQPHAPQPLAKARCSLGPLQRVELSKCLRLVGPGGRRCLAGSRCLLELQVPHRLHQLPIPADSPGRPGRIATGQGTGYNYTQHCPQHLHAVPQLRNIPRIYLALCKTRRPEPPATVHVALAPATAPAAAGTRQRQHSPGGCQQAPSSESTPRGLIRSAPARLQGWETTRGGSAPQAPTSKSQGSPRPACSKSGYTASIIVDQILTKKRGTGSPAVTSSKIDSANAASQPRGDFISSFSPAESPLQPGLEKILHRSPARERHVHCPLSRHAGHNRPFRRENNFFAYRAQRKRRRYCARMDGAGWRGVAWRGGFNRAVPWPMPCP